MNMCMPDSFMWKSEDNFQESDLAFYHVGPGIEFWSSGLTAALAESSSDPNITLFLPSVWELIMGPVIHIYSSQYVINFEDFIEELV